MCDAYENYEHPFKDEIPLFKHTKAKADSATVFTQTFAFCSNCTELLVLGSMPGIWEHKQTGNRSCT